MNKVTIDQIDEFLCLEKYDEQFTIPYGNFSVNIKPTLTEAERKTFISRVVENAFSGVEYSPIGRRIAFVATFAQMLTNLPVPTRDDDQSTIDIDKLYSIVEGLNIIENAKITSISFNNLLTELEMCIEQEIDLKNRKLIALYGMSSATDDAIESFSFAMNKVLDLCETAINQLEKNGNKLFKSLTPKKINGLLEKIQNTLPKAMSELEAKSAEGGNVIDIGDRKK